MSASAAAGAEDGAWAQVTSSEGRAPAPGHVDRAAPRNEVLLVGRVSGSPEERTLPSGDRLVTWRLVVERGPGRRPPEGVRATTVDTFDCVAWATSVRRRASALLPDDIVEIQGQLRRRFWRAGGGAASRCEVEAASLRRLSRRAPAAP